MNNAVEAGTPEWQVSRWFNAAAPLRLADLRGQVVLVHTFQMLCPGCVTHGLPLASKVHEAFGNAGVTVVGLHTVFEHHDAMQPHALQAFIHEYRLRFPIGVDEPSTDQPIPRTMATWGLRGTPTTLLFDREGKPRLHRFGAVDELDLGAWIGRLLAEPAQAGAHGVAAPAGAAAASASCADQACPAPR